jgi:hypothetical protein
VFDIQDALQSQTVKVATFLERYLRLAFIIGIRATRLTAGLFLIYALTGISSVFFGRPALSYPVFSLEGDPIFVIGGALMGLLVVQSSGSFVLYHQLVGTESDRSQVAILFGFISLGFGGSSPDYTTTGYPNDPLHYLDGYV